MSIGNQMQTELQRYFDLRQHSDPVFAGHLHQLQAWQASRLQETHAALLADKRFHDATAFFLSDVYGGIDLSQMAKEIERAMRLAQKLLPDRVLATSAMAMEVNALTQELDERVTDLLFNQMGHTVIEAENYAEAFRQTATYEERLHQVELVRELGYGLDKYVRSRMLFATFKMVKKPVKKAGFDTLYDFLDQGFQVMRPMGSAHEFINLISDAEIEIMGRIYANESDPFRPKSA